MHFLVFTVDPRQSRKSATASIPLKALGLTGPCRVRDLWARRDAEVTNENISREVPVHGAVLLRLQPGGGATVKPRQKSVRIVYLVSADRSVRADFRKGIETAANDLQAWYAKQLSGPTFRLNDPVVEVVKSDKSATWFYSHPNGGDKDDWGFNNGLAEAQRLLGARQGDPQYVWVIYSDGPGNKGQGGDGVAVLPEDDLLGLVGQHPEQKDVKRWIAGLGHELGHAFGLEHPRDTEKYADAIMWMGIYGKYPDKTYLTPEDKKTLMRSPFFFRPNGEPVLTGLERQGG